MKTASTSKLFAKVLLLILVREGYLLARNILGLLLHPYKTLFRIIRDRDFSQAALILSLLGGAWLFLGVLLLALWLFEPGGILRLAVKAGILGGGIFVLGASLYLLYWVVILIKNLSRTSFLNPKDLL